eukprot:gene105-4354_t
MSSKQFSRHEVKKLSNHETDLIVIVNNLVYDLTKYHKVHPGGKEIILDHCGEDATEKWLLAGHSPKSQEKMKTFTIGKIKESEHIEFENPMQKGFLAQNFPYISSAIAVVLIYFCWTTFDAAMEQNESSTTKHSKLSSIYPFLIGIFPSLFLILSALKLWGGHSFRVHRIGGLLFLIQYAASWYYFFSDYQWFKESFLVWSLLLNGISQALSAIIQIGPTLEEDDSGEYFGNKNSTVSKAFITENLYYQILTAFSSIYYYPQFYDMFKSNLIGRLIEIIFVFLPFIVIRPFFPKTLLRKAIGNSENINTDDHRIFFILSNWAIKFCVLFGKHYVGFFINAVRYLGGLNTPHAEKLLQFMMLANAGTVSISTFLHTLKFKNKLSPKVSMSIYLMILYTPAIAIYQLTPLCYPYWKLFIIFTISLLVNFCDKKVQIGFTMLYTSAFVAYSNDYLPQIQQYIL